LKRVNLGNGCAKAGVISLTCMNLRDKLDMEEVVNTTSYDAVGKAEVARRVCGKAKSATGGTRRGGAFRSDDYGRSLSGSLSKNKR